MASKQILTTICLATALAFPAAARGRHHQVRSRTFVATAFATEGTTSSGVQAQRGVVAADTRVLPMGTIIRVRNAGPYSGTYTVADTGAKILGMHIDIFMPSRWRAKLFGKKLVQVTVLQRPGPQS